MSFVITQLPFLVFCCCAYALPWKCDPLSRNVSLLRFHNYSPQPSCHIAPSILLLTPNSLSKYYRCLFFDVSARDILQWLNPSCSYHCLSASRSPSSRTLVPGGSLVRWQLIQMYHFPFLLSLMRVACTLTFPALILFPAPIFASEEAIPPQ
jgi:hypothetical protein